MTKSTGPALELAAVAGRVKEFKHIYEVRPRKDKRSVDLISDALPFGGLWYAEPNATANAIGYAKHYSRSHDAVTCVSDDTRHVIETHDKLHAD